MVVSVYAVLVHVRARELTRRNVCGIARNRAIVGQAVHHRGRGRRVFLGAGRPRRAAEPWWASLRAWNSSLGVGAAAHQRDFVNGSHVYGSEFGGRFVCALALADRAARRRRLDPLRHHLHGQLAVGMFSPPFGLNIFVSCSIFKVPSSRVVSGLVPFFVAYLIGLVIITYIPRLSLFLPELMFK